MPKRWSKLKKEIESLFDESLKLDIYCIDVNRSFNSKNGNMGEGLSMLSLGNYKVNLNSETIWNFPKDFKAPNWERWPEGNPWKYSVSEINVLVREYIDTPKEQLLSKKFEEDLFGLTKILLAADRRISITKLEQYFGDHPNDLSSRIMKLRTSNIELHH